MRFAYIDSQGNEVSIPSVDALALRIELGAIGPQTQLYDAQAERWGPAESHEIFHSLSRDVGGEGFLVPAPPPPPAEEPMGSAPEEPVDPAAEPDPPAPADPGDGTFGLTLAPGLEFPSEPEPRAPDRSSESAADDPAELDLTFVDPDPVVEDPAPGGSHPEDRGGGDDRTFDHDPAAGLPMDGLDVGSGAAGGDAPAPDAPMWFEGGFGDEGLELESSMEFTTSEPPDTEPLELDDPMSAFDPSGPPAWMEQDGPVGSGEDAMDFSAPRVEEAPPERVRTPDVPKVRTGAAPRPRPRRPPRRSAGRSGALGRLVLAIVLVGAVGGGGYFAWERFAERLVPEPPRPPVVIPEIPPELEAPMRELAEAAIPAMFKQIEATALGEDFPVEPSEDWLAGVYLANASSFGQVETFWTGIGRFAEELEARELETFGGHYRALADYAQSDSDARGLMVERADSGFLATRDRRVDSYRMLGRLAASALALHDFLLEHEAEIVYTPATAFSGNPVEEAIPATEEIGERMWELVEDITNAMDALGTLDRVSRERLSGVLLARVTEVGIE